MTVDPEISPMLATLRSQVTGLRSSMESAHETAPAGAPPVGELFDGPMMTSLLTTDDPSWFSRYLHSLSHIGTTRFSAQQLLIATLLALQLRFKNLILESPQYQTMFLGPLGKYTPDPSDIDACIWFKSFVLALIKSKEDKPRAVSAQLKSAGLTYADQLRFEQSVASNPEVASAMGSAAGASEEWSVDLPTSNQLLALLISDQLVKGLVQVKAAEALACICRVSEYRPVVIRQHGVQVLVEGAKKLEPERKEQIHVALARLCMTTDPRAWKYPQVVELSDACYDVISTSSYELYLFEAGIGLVNLLSYSPEVVDSIGSREDAVGKFFELITGSEDERVQLAGVELVCNLSCSEKFVERIAEGQYFESLKILLFLSEKGSDPIRAAASGALAILSGYDALTSVMENLVGSGSVLVGILEDETTSPDVQVRVVSIMSNLIEFTTKDELKSVLVAEMKSLKKRIDHQSSPASERIMSIVGSYC